VLVQKIAGAILATFIERAFGLGAAEPRAVGIGQLCRLFPFVTLPESLQVDHVGHVRLHHRAARRHDNSLAGKTSSCRAPANWMVIRNPRVALSDSIKKVGIKKYVSLCENRIITAPTMRQCNRDR